MEVMKLENDDPVNFVLSANCQISTFNTVGGEESDVPGFQRVVGGEVGGTRLRL